MVHIVPVVFFGNKTYSVPGNPLSWTDCSTSSFILQFCSSAAIYWSSPSFWQSRKFLIEPARPPP